MSELLPCPFCGADGDNINVVENVSSGSYHVECWNDCAGRGPDRRKRSKAVAAWNTRHVPYLSAEDRADIGDSDLLDWLADRGLAIVRVKP